MNAVRDIGPPSVDHPPKLHDIWCSLPDYVNHVVKKAHYSEIERMFKAKIDDPRLPKNYKQAINDAKWRVAIDEETHQL